MDATALYDGFHAAIPGKQSEPRSQAKQTALAQPQDGCGAADPPCSRTIHSDGRGFNAWTGFVCHTGTPRARGFPVRTAVFAQVS